MRHVGLAGDFVESAVTIGLEAHKRTKFVCRLEQRDVDFRSRGRTAIARAVAIKEFIQPWHLRCTAVYGPGHVEALARVVGNRIGKLSEL